VSWRGSETGRETNGAYARVPLPIGELTPAPPLSLARALSLYLLPHPATSAAAAAASSSSSSSSSSSQSVGDSPGLLVPALLAAFRRPRRCGGGGGGGSGGSRGGGRGGGGDGDGGVNGGGGSSGSRRLSELQWICIGKIWLPLHSQKAPRHMSPSSRPFARRRGITTTRTTTRRMIIHRSAARLLPDFTFIRPRSRAAAGRRPEEGENTRWLAATPRPHPPSLSLSLAALSPLLAASSSSSTSSTSRPTPPLSPPRPSPPHLATSRSFSRLPRCPASDASDGTADGSYYAAAVTLPSIPLEGQSRRGKREFERWPMFLNSVTCPRRKQASPTKISCSNLLGAPPPSGPGRGPTYPSNLILLTDP
jgi:hypothetical protein